MAENNLKQRTFNAIIWNTIEKVLVKGSAFIISIILARILSPTDYGLIGMLSLFITLSGVFIESGISRALIQNQKSTDIDYSTAFYSNIGIAIVVYFILFFSAPYIANFYSEPILCNLLRILSLNIVISSVTIVQRAKLVTKMDFKSLAKINFISNVIGGVIGVAMAYTGFGVWSLVGNTLASTIITIILFPYYAKWRPMWAFSMESFKRLFNFGYKLLISSIVATIVNNISTIAIGKAYKSAQLGHYTRAVSFSDTIAWTLHDVIGSVSFPVLSSLQDEKERLLNVYKKTLWYTALLVFPVMILMAVVAKPMVIVLLTEKWLPCVFYLQIMCIARMFIPIAAINLNLMNALGRSDLFMKTDLSKTPLILIMLAITIPISVKAIVIGTLVNTIICFFINTYYPGKLLGYGALQQILDYKKIGIALLLMIAAAYGVMQLFTTPILQFVIGGVAGVGVYVLACYIFKIVDMQELMSFIKRK